MARRPSISAISVLLAAAAAFGASGCGGGSSPTTPTVPTPTPTPQNRPPVITSATVSPEFAVQGLATITYSVTANDPDGDPLTYQWTFGTLTRTDASGTFDPAGAISGARVTVSDNRGANASETRALVVAHLTGTWNGVQELLGAYTFTLTQAGIVVSGTYRDSEGPGRLDAADGRVDQAGNIAFRVKQPPFADYFFRGQIDRSTGTRITGGLFESGFTGQPFELTKQSSLTAGNAPDAPAAATTTTLHKARRRP
jgi:hypothetical protein